MIVSLGEALIDLIHSPDAAEPKALAGGSPYNVAIALSRLGVKTGFVCPFSTDQYGKQLIRILDDNKVQRCVEALVDAPTAIAEVFTNADGHPRYVFHREHTADRALSQRPPSEAIPSSTRALHFGSLVLAQEEDWTLWRQAIITARDHGAFIAFDPNLRPALIDDIERHRARVEDAVSLAHLVKASDEDLSLLNPSCSPAEQIQRWRSPNRSVVLTEGAKGAQIWTRAGHHSTYKEISSTPIVDTVGAGDTFQAALLAWLWRRDDFESDLTEEEAQHLLIFASKAAFLNCTRAGCQPPMLDDVVAIT